MGPPHVRDRSRGRPLLFGNLDADRGAHGIKFFNWIGMMRGGKIRSQTPMSFWAGFLFMFLIGGITGVFLASPPLDYFVHDTYYVVAHHHYVLFGGSVFAMFAGLNYWIPKMSGGMLSERLGKLHFALLLVGMNATFFPMYQLGIDGMRRRIPHYPASFGYAQENLLSTAGAYLTALAVLVFFVNLFVWRAAALSRVTILGTATLSSAPLPHLPPPQLPPAASNPLCPAGVRRAPQRPGGGGGVIEELRLFVRVALYAAPAAALYWLLSSEISGTWMLAALVVAVAMWVVAGTALSKGAAAASNAAHLIGFDETETESQRSSLALAPQTLPGPSAWPAAAALAAFITGPGAVYGGWFAVPACCWALPAGGYHRCRCGPVPGRSAS